MLKAADSLQAAGYDVRVVCSEFLEWCIAAERELLQERTWRRRPVKWRKNQEPWLYHTTRARHRLYRWAANAASPQILSLGTLAKASCRVASELVKATTEEPCDLVYAGTARGIAVGAVAASRCGAALAVDLEDFHTAEQPEGRDGNRVHRLMAEIERRVIPQCAFYTTSSTPIAAELERLYSRTPVVLHNVFRLPRQAPTLQPHSKGRLRLIWFSQYIGANRGLEDVVAACRLSGIPVRLGLAGNETAFSKNLVGNCVSANLEIRLLGVLPPDQLEGACRNWDIGLALEPGFSQNNCLALSNKICTYALAGLAIAATDTPGQRELETEFGPGIHYYRSGDASMLADGLRRWADAPSLLTQAKEASWNAAVRRWRWDHSAEEGALLAAVETAIGPP